MTMNYRFKQVHTLTKEAVPVFSCVQATCFVMGAETWPEAEDLKTED